MLGDNFAFAHAVAAAADGGQKAGHALCEE
jgi:hypothetical protein